MDGLKFTGIGISGSKVSVHMVQRTGGVPRFRTVNFAVDELIQDEILYEIYRAAARALRLAWEDPDAEAPALFE